nr:zinc ribbon domain-containing protein [Vibrio metschnikovii]
MLRYKAEEASSEFVEVPTKQVKPSQTCPDCGAKKKKLLAERWHSCTAETLTQAKTCVMQG